MNFNRFDPEFFAFAAAWRNLTPWQKFCIIQRARVFIFLRRVLRAWVIAKAEAAGVIWLAPMAFYWIICAFILGVI